jgi:hypothetical protein
VTDKVVVVFQNCVNLLENVPGSYSETCHVGIEVIHIKVEEVTDMQEEEVDPVLVPFSEIKAEPEVSFMSPLLGTFHRYTELPAFFFVPHVCYPHEASLLW